MRASRIAVLITIAILTTSTSVISASAAGRTAASIPNTILNGKGVPITSLGINGDFYIDTRSLLIYGPKAKGKWPLPQNLQGPIGATGVTGSDGKNGSDAKVGTNNANIVGTTGPQGERGLTGAAGPAGPAGAAASSGSGGGTPGANGAAGATGATGASGAAGSIGPSGPTGSTGSTGLTGAAGAQGEGGSAGSAGTSGISKAIAASFSIGDISGNAGTSNTGSITGFKANKSYVLRLNIVGYQPSDSSEYILPMSLSFTAINGAPVVVSSYSLVHGHSYRAGAIRYENSFVADVTLDGTGVVTDYGLTLTIIAGRATNSNQLVRFISSYVALQVDTVASTF
ncbi:MAG: hypothetical protein EXQ78_03840 [Candidatus Planktophila sp.]|nr:hypothetical protein [Candidatus Planktophila sp.]